MYFLLHRIYSNNKYLLDAFFLFSPFYFILSSFNFLLFDFILFKGKRICVGEELARMILFLFAGRILRAFVISVPPDEIVDLEGDCGITLVPKPHRLMFVPRNQ